MPEQFTEDVEANYDPAETGRKGCLEPVIDDESDEGHCDASSEDDE